MAALGHAVQEPPTIGGHPVVLAERDHLGLPPIVLQVCADCGEFLGKVLWLDGDRWKCTTCKGTKAPRRVVLQPTTPKNGRSCS